MWHRIKIIPNDKSVIGKTIRSIIYSKVSIFINYPIVVKAIDEDFILGSNLDNEFFIGMYPISHKNGKFWEIYEEDIKK